MIITTNRYVVQAAYAAQNQEHIRRVMEELRALHRTDLKYSAFVEDDGKTFIHLRFCANEEASKVCLTRWNPSRRFKQRFSQVILKYYPPQRSI